MELTPEDKKKVAEWKKTLPDIEPTAIGGAYTYCFTPTGLGTIIKVTRFDGYELDLTDSDNW